MTLSRASEEWGNGPKDGEKMVSTNGASQRLQQAQFLDPNHLFLGLDGWEGMAKAPVRQPRLAQGLVWKQRISFLL